MIRPFGLNDVWLVRRLQRSGMPMAIEHTLTSMSSAIAQSLCKHDLPDVMGVRARSHYVSVEFAGPVPGGLIASLERAKVHASARGRWLRVTPHLYNSPEDVDRLLHTLVKGSR